MAKKTSFFEKVVSGVTGKTAEQRKADAILKGRIKQKQLASYRAEQLNQASVVGKRRAEIQAKQQIKQMSQAKTTGGLNIGTWGKTQAGFDPMTFGSKAGASMGTPKKKGASPMDVAYMKFPDYTKPMKKKVKKRMKKKRIKKKGKGKKQSFTITMNK